jgi:hypothetical protein
MTELLPAWARNRSIEGRGLREAPVELPLGDPACFHRSARFSTTNQDGDGSGKKGERWQGIRIAPSRDDPTSVVGHKTIIRASRKQRQERVAVHLRQFGFGLVPELLRPYAQEVSVPAVADEKHLVGAIKERFHPGHVT